MTRHKPFAHRRNATRIRQTFERIGRTRVMRAFRNLAHGVDSRDAHDRMRAFYRSSGAPWSRCLA